MSERCGGKPGEPKIIGWEDGEFSVTCPGCADCKPCKKCGGTGLHKSVPYDAQCNWCHGTGREP